MPRSAGTQKRSLSISGHRTSIALEPPFWEALEELAARRGLSLPALVAEIDAARGTTGTLSSALRVHVVRALRT